jgi:hypothetical protein
LLVTPPAILRRSFAFLPGYLLAFLSAFHRSQVDWIADLRPL